jgi:hypothetical protein
MRILRILIPNTGKYLSWCRIQIQTAANGHNYGKTDEGYVYQRLVAGLTYAGAGLCEGLDALYAAPGVLPAQNWLLLSPGTRYQLQALYRTHFHLCKNMNGLKVKSILAGGDGKVKNLSLRC